ncbi:charged multivesicular body protein 6-like isoform X1 [Leptotrombidium deliense]|uniref:Charged multivesicular body protein 6-like isoform X1 n=1 Tax=Leptotrombidium deliense TaxID=299467 RepID=A0A443S7P5_9ACAR|nr:charged multivesicular body protein 6-like isoform X1 [Leptotrombidium deliense]
MGALFGKFKSSNKVNSKVTEQDKVILQLKQQRDKLKQYQKRIREQLDKEKDMARQLLKDNRKEFVKALLLLKKKKFMETLLDRTDNQLDNLEKMATDIEFAQIEVKVMEGLKSGNDSLKQLHSIMSIEQIESIMDETKESVEKQKEIDNLLSGAFTQEEESDLLEELEKMTAEESVPISDKLPEVPSHEPKEGSLYISKEKQEKKKGQEKLKNN